MWILPSHIISEFNNHAGIFQMAFDLINVKRNKICYHQFAVQFWTRPSAFGRCSSMVIFIGFYEVSMDAYGYNVTLNGTVGAAFCLNTLIIHQCFFTWWMISKSKHNMHMPFQGSERFSRSKEGLIIFSDDDW